MEKVKITILNDNVAGNGCGSEHGLSFLVEADSKFLFDTGPSDIIIKNAQILGVDLNAAEAEVRKAYIKLIKENHPDKVQNLSADFRDLAEKKTKEINKAYEYIESKRNLK